MRRAIALDQRDGLIAGLRGDLGRPDVTVDRFTAVDDQRGRLVVESAAADRDGEPLQALVEPEDRPLAAGVTVEGGSLALRPSGLPLTEPGEEVGSLHARCDQEVADVI